MEAIERFEQAKANETALLKKEVEVDRLLQQHPCDEHFTSELRKICAKCNQNIYKDAFFFLKCEHFQHKACSFLLDCPWCVSCESYQDIIKEFNSLEHFSEYLKAENEWNAQYAEFLQSLRAGHSTFPKNRSKQHQYGNNL